MIRLIIFVVSAGLLLNACSSKVVDDNVNSFEVKTVVVDKTPPKMPTLALDTVPVLSGTWRSVKPEPAGNGNYLIREYTLAKGHWQLTSTLAADKEMKSTVSIYRAQGGFQLDRPSRKVPGTYEATFKYASKSLNLQTTDKEKSKELGFDGCKQLRKGQEVEISTLGCASYKSIGECPKDFELVKIEGTLLQFGERPSDNGLCSAEHRPEGLGPQLRKVN